MKKHLTIVLIDDDPLDIELFRAYISRIKEFQADILAFHDWGTGARSLAKADIVVLDYYLGAETALDIIKKIKHQGCDIPVIILTSSEDTDTAAKISRHGADDYLVKNSVDAIQLKKSILNALERFDLRQERNILKEQIQTLQRLEAMGTLAGGIAHDFNNILSPIMGYAEMMLTNDSLDNSAKNGLIQIIKGATRAKDLIHQILTFSNQQGQHQVLPLKMHLIVNEALKLMRASLPSTIRVSASIDKKNTMVMADPTQIHQIIVNLMTNAFHAMEKTGGELSISLKTVTLHETMVIMGINVIPGEYVNLCVKDTGHGIPQNIQNQIFEPYFTTKKKGKGTGLGMAMVHGIVKKSNGYISLFSEEGKGTAFQIYLPQLKNNKIAQTTRKTEEKVNSIPNAHVLIVDDEEPVLLMEKLMLTNFGYHVTTACSSSKALEVFKNAPDKFDLVLTDLTMPHLTGIQLAAAMLKIRPDLPVILCTGYCDADIKNQTIHTGIKDLIMKPIAQRELAQVLLKNIPEKEFHSARTGQMENLLLIED